MGQFCPYLLCPFRPWTRAQHATTSYNVGSGQLGASELWWVLHDDRIVMEMSTMPPFTLKFPSQPPLVLTGGRRRRRRKGVYFFTPPPPKFLPGCPPSPPLAWPLAGVGLFVCCVSFLHLPSLPPLPSPPSLSFNLSCQDLSSWEEQQGHKWLARVSLQVIPIPNLLRTYDSPTSYFGRWHTLVLGNRFCCRTLSKIHVMSNWLAGWKKSLVDLKLYETYSHIWMHYFKLITNQWENSSP